MIKRFLIAFVACISFPACAAGLDANEQRMVEWVDAHAEDAIALLEETVNIPSGTMNPDGVRAVGAVMRRELDALGLETEWIELPPELQRASRRRPRTGRRSREGGF